MVKIKLLKLHMHGGREYQFGDEIEVSETQAKWLISIGTAEIPSTVIPSHTEGSHQLKSEDKDNTPHPPLKLRGGDEVGGVTEDKNNKTKKGGMGWKKRFIR